MASTVFAGHDARHQAAEKSNAVALKQESKPITVAMGMLWLGVLVVIGMGGLIVLHFVIDHLISR